MVLQEVLAVVVTQVLVLEVHLLDQELVMQEALVAVLGKLHHKQVEVVVEQEAQEALVVLVV